MAVTRRRGHQNTRSTLTATKKNPCKECRKQVRQQKMLQLRAKIRRQCNKSPNYWKFHHMKKPKCVESTALSHLDKVALSKHVAQLAHVLIKKPVQMKNFVIIFVSGDK